MSPSSEGHTLKLYQEVQAVLKENGTIAIDQAKILAEGIINHDGGSGGDRRPAL